MSNWPTVYVRPIHDLSREGSEGYERATHAEEIDLWSVYRSTLPEEGLDGLPVWVQDFALREEAVAYARHLAAWADAEYVMEGIDGL